MRSSLQRAAILVALLLVGNRLRADITLPAAASPQADGVTLTIRRGQTIAVQLRAHYGGSDLVTFQIVKRPGHGGLSDLRLLGDNRGSITYRNDNEPGIGEDTFRYVVKTGSGRTSSPAEVRIAIEEPPPRIELPARIDFGPILAGQTVSRPFAIRNAGGGVAQGRLTVSAPWQIDRTQYSVTAGAEETLRVNFQPHEPRNFVGQLTLNRADGGQNTVWLEGNATPPLTVIPDTLWIAADSEGGAARSGSFSLTNRTDGQLRLEFEAGPKFRAIDDVVLEPKEKKEIAVSAIAKPTPPVDESIAIVGPGFRMSLPVTAEEARSARIASSTPNAIAVQATTPAAMEAPTPTKPVGVVPTETVASTPAAPAAEPLVAIHAQRLDAAHWELRWFVPKEQVANYRVEERLLSLESPGQLQIGWRAVASPEIRTEGKSVVAKISGLNPKELHVIRVIAVAPDNATLWESPLVSLSPPASKAHSGHGWLIAMALVLVALLSWRWRISRVRA